MVAGINYSTHRNSELDKQHISGFWTDGEKKHVNMHTRTWKTAESHLI